VKPLGTLPTDGLRSIGTGVGNAAASVFYKVSDSYTMYCERSSSSHPMSISLMNIKKRMEMRTSIVEMRVSIKK